MTKVPKIHSNKRKVYSIKDVEKAGYPHAKKEKKKKKLDPYFTLRARAHTHTRAHLHTCTHNSKWMRNLNVRPETVQLLKKI